MAGTLRAEATLAAANLVWFLLLFFGGVLFPLSKFPAGLASVLQLLPTAALPTGCAACCGTAPGCRCNPCSPSSGGPFSRSARQLPRSSGSEAG